MISNSKEWLELGLIQCLNRRTLHLQRSDRTKGFEFLGVAHFRKVNTWREVMEDKG